MPETPEPHDFNDGAGAPDPVDEAFVAYLKARDAGKVSSREEFVLQFPDLNPQLGELLDAADLIEQLAGSSSSDNAVAEGDAPKSDPFAETLPGVAPRLDDLEPDATLASTPIPGEDAGPALPFEMGDYVLERVLGRGGMGVVYLARQKNLDRPVAVKMIRSGVLAGSDEIKRFSAEAKAAARLKHPNIVGVYHFGIDAGHYYFSMDYVEGSDLSKKVDAGPQDFRESARYVRDVARAIHYAHQRGLLHRDLKPANVLIDDSDQVHVTDFGLAKLVDAESSLTASGAAIGTPNYMAPEQASGDTDLACHGSDVYSLGAILFALATGRPPFVTDSVMKTLLHVIHRPPPTLRSLCDAPSDMETIVAKCLEKTPSKRYESAADLADDLDRFLAGRPINARPRSVVSKGIDWLLEVPIFSALAGRRIIHTSPSHRRFQAFLLSLPIVVLLAWVGMGIINSRLPNNPQIAGGPRGDAYDRVASVIAERLTQMTPCEATTVETDGSVENVRRLLDGEVDLAILQASAVRGDNVAVIAPLYYEAVHVLARSDSGIETLAEIEGQRVAIGADGSGSQLAARMLVESLGFSPQDLELVPVSIADLTDEDDIPIAITCVARGGRKVSEALNSGNFRMLAIDDAMTLALDHPTFRPLHIDVADYPDADLPKDGIATVGTTAFLAARHETSGSLVTAALEAVYQETIDVPGMISRSHAAEWQGLALHPAARAYYARD